MKLDTIKEYKHKEYLRFGFTEYQASQLLKERNLSAAEVRTLISKGCDVNIAYRIFRP